MFSVLEVKAPKKLNLGAANSELLAIPSTKISGALGALFQIIILQVPLMLPEVLMPDLAQVLIAPGAHAVKAVFGWMGEVVVLVDCLGRIELLQGGYFDANWFAKLPRLRELLF